MSDKRTQHAIAIAVARLGIAEVARRLSIDPFTVAGIQAGLDPKPTIMAKARARLHLLNAEVQP